MLRGVLGRVGSVIVLGTLVIGVVAPGRAVAQDSDAAELELAQRYAPIVFVRPQDAPCDTNGEPFEPAPVEIVLDNPEIVLRQVGNYDPVVMTGPGAADLFDRREGWYLDFPGDALDPGCIFEQDFRRFYDGQSVMYAHVATEDGRRGRLALQYWLFWYHNPAKNDHEGDWEFIQLTFDADTAEQALATQPRSVGFAQHTGGERSDWDDSKLDKEGDHPIAYPAQGSHATYFDQALYLGRSGPEGFGCDNTDDSTRRLEPEVVLLPDTVDAPTDPLAWLAFQGRWGQRESGFFNGPTGPYAKDRWTRPITWEEGLRNSSVVIPGGDRQGASVINTFCRVVEVGSSILVIGIRSPVMATLLLLSAIVVSAVLAGRTRWRPVVTTPIRTRRAIGQIIVSALRVWRERPVAMVWIGLVYVPVAVVTSFIQVGVQQLPLVDHMLELVDDHSAMAAMFAIFVGGFGNLLAFVYVSAAVAVTIERGSWDFGRLLGGQMTAVTLGRLIGAVLRAALIVSALMISVIGIPWAIRQLVRYQVVPQVVALEGLHGRAALVRSSELVRRRWWWTGGVIAVLQATIVVAGLGSALLVLVIATSIPLWLFSVLSSVIFVVLIPVGAAAMAYVYGTLERGASERPEHVDDVALASAP